MPYNLNDLIIAMSNNTSNDYSLDNCRTLTNSPGAEVNMASGIISGITSVTLNNFDENLNSQTVTVVPNIVFKSDGAFVPLFF